MAQILINGFVSMSHSSFFTVANLKACFFAWIRRIPAVRNKIQVQRIVSCAYLTMAVLGDIESYLVTALLLPKISCFITGQLRLWALTSPSHLIFV